MSCNLLLHTATSEGRVPTTPTISSIIGGIQVQEAVKLLHGMPTLASKGYIFEGLRHTSYVVDYTENPECISHYILENVVHIPESSSALTLEQLSKRASNDLGSDQVVLEFSRDIIHKLVCPKCGEEEECFVPVGAIGYGGAVVVGATAKCAWCKRFRGIAANRSLPTAGWINWGFPFMTYLTRVRSAPRCHTASRATQ